MNKKTAGVALGMAAVMALTVGGSTFVYADEEERPAYVHDESEVTGTITVYTTMEQTQQEVLEELWSKYYPDCKMEIQADSVGTLATRIRGDESCDADVVIGGLLKLMEILTMIFYSPILQLLMMNRLIMMNPAIIHIMMCR